MLDLLVVVICYGKDELMQASRHWQTPAETSRPLQASSQLAIQLILKLSASEQLIF
jgi:hypothetical protein